MMLLRKYYVIIIVALCYYRVHIDYVSFIWLSCTKCVMNVCMLWYYGMFVFIVCVLCGYCDVIV